MDSWIIMPVVDCLDFTQDAVEDCLVQTGLSSLPRILLIDNGSTRETRQGLEAMVLDYKGRILYWPHNPPLGGPPQGTVNASWNAGLDFVWHTGASSALVINNDVRLREDTYDLLLHELDAGDALFVSAVGVREEQYAKYMEGAAGHSLVDGRSSHGGPDFSCFVLSKECHERFRFDEAFTYFGDNDYHRRLQLGGEGDRIYSINVPYLHFSSRTVNRSPEAKEAAAKVFAKHEKLYLEKWGGMPHHENYATPFNR